MGKEKNFSEAALSALTAMSERYSSMFWVELDSMRYEVLKTFDAVREITESNPRADDAYRRYVETTVVAEYREVMLAFGDFATLRSRLAGKEVISVEYRSTTRGRNWCKGFCVPIDKEDGEVKTVVMAFEDIHDSKLKDERLEQQLRYINGLLSSYDDVIVCDMAEDTCIQPYHNEEKPSLMPQAKAGETYSTYMQALMQSYCHPEHLEAMLCYADLGYVSSVMSGRKRHTHRFLLCKGEGEYEWNEMTIIKFAEAGETAREIAVTFMNVDADEHEKREQQATLDDVKKIIRSSEMGIWHITLIQGKAPRMNADAKMKELLGLDVDAEMTEEEIYSSWYDKVHPEAVESVNASVMKMIRDGVRDENTYKWMHPRLGERYVRCGGTAKPIMGGHILSGYHYDVTEQVMAEKRRKQITEEALKANKSKTVYLHNMIHEIRTPLNAIVGFSQLLGMPDGTWSEEDKRQHMRQIENAYRMLSMLIDDVLDVADSEHGNYVVKMEETNVNATCRNAVLAVEFRRPSDVKLIFTSEVDDEYTIMSDGRRIAQVLTNFLTNACKHTRAGKIELHCSTTENAGRLTFSVTDTGEGVPSDMAQKIFKRFKKHNACVEGSGLGLNICTMVAEKLHGEVRLDTTYKSGARFVFIL